MTAPALDIDIASVDAAPETTWDGRTVLLMRSVDGREVRLRLPACALPVVRGATPDSGPVPRLPLPPAEAVSCRVDCAGDPGFAILTLETAAHRGASFVVAAHTLERLAALIDEYHLDAFPDGLAVP